MALGRQGIPQAATVALRKMKSEVPAQGCEVVFGYGGRGRGSPSRHDAGTPDRRAASGPKSARALGAGTAGSIPTVDRELSATRDGHRQPPGRPRLGTAEVVTFRVPGRAGRSAA